MLFVPRRGLRIPVLYVLSLFNVCGCRIRQLLSMYIRVAKVWKTIVILLILMEVLSDDLSGATEIVVQNDVRNIWDLESSHSWLGGLASTCCRCNKEDIHCLPRLGVHCPPRQVQYFFLIPTPHCSMTGHWLGSSTIFVQHTVCFVPKDSVSGNNNIK